MSPEAKRGEVNLQQVVRALLITADGYLCIGKRAKGENDAGKWCLVGGMAEGATLNKELLRELSEEIGVPTDELLAAGEPLFAFSVDRKKGGAVWRNNYFIMELDDLLVPQIEKSFNRREFSKIAFVLEDDIKGLKFAFGNGKAVRNFFKYVGN